MNFLSIDAKKRGNNKTSKNNTLCTILLQKYKLLLVGPRIRNKSYLFSITNIWKLPNCEMEIREISQSLLQTKHELKSQKEKSKTMLLFYILFYLSFIFLLKCFYVIPCINSIKQGIHSDLNLWFLFFHFVNTFYWVVYTFKVFY